MIVLGLNAYHGDSSAALVQDGKLIAAAEEERFRRIKHWSGLPTEAMKWCLADAGLTLGDVDHIAINRNPKVNNLRRALYVLRRRPSLSLIFKRLANIKRAGTFEDAVQAAFPGENLRAQVHRVEHHLAHLASAFLVSAFDEAVCLSVDGFGDFASSAWGMGKGNDIQIDGRVYFPHSLGIFYSVITQFIGFPYFGDEYKVMGLAPYGEPKYLDEMRELVKVRPDGTFRLNLKYFRHHDEDVHYTWDNCSPEVGTLYKKEPMEALFGPQREKGAALEQKHRDLARSAQAMYEEAFFAMLQSLHAKYQCDDLTLSGGCAMNSVANGKVYLNSPFKRMYLPASAGDAGGAIGSAFVVSRQFHREKFVMDHAYVGPCTNDIEIKTLLDARATDIQSENCTVRRFDDEGELCQTTATAITEGKVIGWFQGRMEWGPRALGNRSILGDPRRADMKDILNLKIKRRESFRPFAPSIMREHVSEWFEQDDDVPFMMEVFQVRQDKRAQIPATTHVDGSGRLQTVHKATNPRYHRLIESYRQITGVPMVLNTSFNENEPVVCKPQEALDCFLRTKMDVLVLNDWMVTRS
ncbi:carbamoyltransferase C-terminal domain-containing protein [Prosthecobacter sp.]|uniref:carbamoyltransferase family protein n=1 Tax=Prosthecobacter sp. TaxID=1965333 RepID=UPI002AB9EF1D|nr:carbamoyltransferase C-terminal domain-containing protein [Prosthecobacter sp.]MDZ4404125.1 carbamoyltransferase C-terminal domain-containing protein [Prosthecobacter sp.]